MRMHTAKSVFIAILLLWGTLALASGKPHPDPDEVNTVLLDDAPAGALPKDKQNVADPAEKAKDAAAGNDAVYLRLPTYPQNIRQPIGVNLYYPANVQELYRTLASLDNLQALPPVDGVGKVFLSPWGEIGGALPTASKVYRYIRDHGGAKTIVLLSSPYGFEMKSPASVWPSGGYATPLKITPVNAVAAMSLLKNPLFTFEQAAHKANPTIETNVLLIQHYLPDAKIVPVLVNPKDRKQLEDIAQSLAKITRAPGNILVVVSNLSTGFSTRKEAGALDIQTLQSLSTLNLNIINSTGKKLQEQLPQGVSDITAPRAVLTGFLSALLLEMDTATWLGYVSIAQTPGKPLLTGCVAGVVSARAWTEPEKGDLLEAKSLRLSPEAQKELGYFTRVALEAAAAGARFDVPYPICAELLKKRAAFVTVFDPDMKIAASMGTLNPIERLYVSATEAARMCAVGEDMQSSQKITAENAAEDTVVVSVVRDFRSVGNWQDVHNGDGVVIARGQRRCVVLPVVAKNKKWSVEDMLSFACRRAGLRPDAYRLPSVDVFTFKTDDYTYEGSKRADSLVQPARNK